MFRLVEAGRPGPWQSVEACWREVFRRDLYVRNLLTGGRRLAPGVEIEVASMGDET